ncbi:MAG: hypothetical protein HY931_02225 [Candidatus Falkowbacteria bacterium]|nr:MAG: hypothetical protein HY931_02225 [Candidatus Falkowbacteria bacterium]
MSHQKKLIVIIVLLVLIAAVLSLVFLKKSVSRNSNLAAPTNLESVSTGPIASPEPEALVNNANPNTYSFAGDPQAEKVEVEFMSDTEKQAMGIPTAARIQVLDRDADGKCIAWKTINQDSEILYEYVK